MISGRLVRQCAALLLRGSARTREACPAPGPLAPGGPRKPRIVPLAAGMAHASWDDNNRLQLVQGNALLTSAATPLAHALLERLPGEAEFVLIGEASHGTEDFYKLRGELTKLLISERGFNAVCLEADFPDAQRANMYVRGLSDDTSADEALAGFSRFPNWMWRNTVMVDFVEWLRRHNEGLPAEARRAGGAVGLYGLDVYSLHASAARVVEFLSGVDPEAARTAQARYACFDRYGADATSYAHAVGVGGAPGCAAEAVSVLRDVARKAAQYSEKGDGERGAELGFAAQCNARVVQGAEAYYSHMYFQEESTWNLRDSHFLDTAIAVHQHVSRQGRRPAKLVLWAHNSHVGDARATDMGRQRGELNIGQLMRQRFGMRSVYNIGFTTHSGTVAAADDWDTPVKKKAVRKALPGSYERLFHKAGMPEFALDLRHGSQDLRAALKGPLLERAIGVIYRPQTERQSHYFYTSLPDQFDYIIHIDETSALTPLEKVGVRDWHAAEDAPETFPSGL